MLSYLTIQFILNRKKAAGSAWLGTEINRFSIHFVTFYHHYFLSFSCFGCIMNLLFPMLLFPFSVIIYSPFSINFDLIFVVFCYLWMYINVLPHPMTVFPFFVTINNSFFTLLLIFHLLLSSLSFSSLLNSNKIKLSNSHLWYHVIVTILSAIAVL